MPIKWGSFKTGSPSLLMDKIRKNQHVLPDGRISYQGFVINELTPVILSYLEFPASAKHVDKSSLVWHALMSDCSDIDEKKFIKIINQLLDKEFSKREEDYYLLFTISLDVKGFFKSIRVENCDFQFYSDDFPKKYREHRKVEVDGFEKRFGSPENNYTCVVGKVRAKSEAKSFHDVMRAIDLLRSIMCLIGNPYMQVSLGGRSKDPINVVRFGMIHTLHKGSGEVANPGFGWYEPDFVKRQNFKFKDPSKAKKKIIYSLRRIDGLKYSDKVKESLIRYVRALDEPNYNTAFIGLWGALECLLTPGKADYDKLIRRCAFLFRDVDYFGVLLQHLRVYRNRSIHAGESSDDSKIICYQLQQFYETTIWFVLANGSEFDTLDEMGDFLDIPTDAVLMDKAYRRYKLAAKFRAVK